MRFVESNCIDHFLINFMIFFINVSFFANDACVLQLAGCGEVLQLANLVLVIIL